MLVIRRTIVQMTEDEYAKMLAEEVGVCTCCGRQQSNVPNGTQNMQCIHCHDGSVFSVAILRRANRIEIV